MVSAASVAGRVTRSTWWRGRGGGVGEGWIGGVEGVRVPVQTAALGLGHGREFIVVVAAGE